jgi:hypothetical protein
MGSNCANRSSAVKLIFMGLNMGFWSELKNANPHRTMARGNELAMSIITSMAPIHDKLDGSGEICSVCRAKFGSVGFKNVQPYTVTVNSSTPLTFANSSDLIVCAKCIEVFAIG